MLWWSDKFGRGAGYQEDVGLARNAGLYVENIHAPVHEQKNLDGESVFQSYLQCVTDCQVLIEPLKSYHYGHIMIYIFSVLGKNIAEGSRCGRNRSNRSQKIIDIRPHARNNIGNLIRK